MRPARLPSVLALLLGVAACASPAATPESTPTIGLPDGGTSSPGPSASGSPDPSPPPRARPTTSPVPGTTYTVAPGDSLSAIARAYGTTAAQLQAWNGEDYPSLVTNPGVIEPGWVLIVSGDPDVTPLPVPTAPPPSASGCSANNRVAAGSAQTFSTIPGAGAGVALTFDMGGRMDPAVDIMNFLVDHEVCATIFATGVMSQTDEGQRVMAIVKANPHLFEIANHTMHHCDLVRGGGGSPSTAPCTGSFDADRIRREMTDAGAILRDGTGQSPVPYWRPPYGSVNQAVIDAVASAGYTKTFLWDIDTVDWKPASQGGPTAAQIAAKVVNNSVNGSNVLFHLGGYETLDALGLIVPGLRDRGFTLTSLSDLLN
jgi:peptidoglycan-N-acetylglucosamine deacetylase